MKRWLEPLPLEGAGSSAMERAIHALRAMDASAAEVEALRVRLETALSAEPPVSTTPDASATLSTGAGAHLLKGGVALLLLAAVAFITWRGSLGDAPVPATVTPPPPASSVTPASPGPEPSSEAGPPSTMVVPAATATPEPSAEVRPRAKRRPLSRGAPELQAARSPEAELTLVGRAQAALDQRPDHTLELVAEHARDYPRGVFAEEREVLWMEAQLKLGRRPQVYPRAEEFLARYPRSTHAPRVRALLATQQDPAPAATHGHAQER